MWVITPDLQVLTALPWNQTLGQLSDPPLGTRMSKTEKIKSKSGMREWAGGFLL